jgi:hypothetical protein
MTSLTAIKCGVKSTFIQTCRYYPWCWEMDHMLRTFAITCLIPSEQGDRRHMIEWQILLFLYSVTDLWYWNGKNKTKTSSILKYNCTFIYPRVKMRSFNFHCNDVIWRQKVSLGLHKNTLSALTTQGLVSYCMWLIQILRDGAIMNIIFNILCLF